MNPVEQETIGLCIALEAVDDIANDALRSQPHIKRFVGAYYLKEASSLEQP
jgi:hypothetical protein